MNTDTMKNTNSDTNKILNNKDNFSDEQVKQWREVDGDLDDFIFYYEDKKYLSER